MAERINLFNARVRALSVKNAHAMADATTLARVFKSLSQIYPGGEPSLAIYMADHLDNVCFLEILMVPVQTQTSQNGRKGSVCIAMTITVRSKVHRLAQKHDVKCQRNRTL